MPSILSMFARGSFLALSTMLLAMPTLAQNANFGTMALAPGFSAPSATLTGTTGGSFSISAIANRDRDNNMCLGYGSDRDVPDYVMVLKQNFAQLNVQVKSRQNKTTLLIKGPDGIRCGDTLVSGLNWPSGPYSIWVGGPEPGAQIDYTLSVRE